MVIFVAELKIVEKQCNFRAGNDENEEHQQEEAKNIVIIVHPHRRHDKVEFNKARSERQNSSNHQRKGHTHEPRLIRDLPRNARGFDGVLDGFLLVSKVGSQKKKGLRDSEP
jgi:hypothetical protein